MIAVQEDFENVCPFERLNTLNTYTHLGLDDAADELCRLNDIESARKELDRDTCSISKDLFRAV